jgi:dynein heavy chain 1
MPEMESVRASPASPANGVASNPFPTIDPTLVVEHLVALLHITLGATRRDLENIGSLLSKSRYADTVQRCTRFATESQVALYVQKDVILEADSDLEGTVDDSGNPLTL